MAEVFTSYYLQVPRFQRPYEWLDSDTEDFWTDVASSDRDYFIGSMVVFPSAHGTQGIVDGQQRVTTITLLMCALRDQLRALSLEGATNAASGLHNLVERASVLDNKHHFVLQTEAPNAYLRWIQAGIGGAAEPPRTENEKRLRGAHVKLSSLLQKSVDGLPAESALERLLDIRDKLFGLRVVFVEVDNEDDATIIFQTLNSRGRDLEVSDLVKSHIMSAIGASSNPAHDIPREKWTSILESFEESGADLSIDRFLLHYWLSTHDYVSSKGLFKPVRVHLQRSNVSATSAAARELLDDLVREADFYRTIHEPDYRDGWVKQEQSLKNSLESIQLFRLRQPTPWVLAVWSEHRAGRLKLREATNAIELIEKYHFVATAVSNQPSSGGVSKMYAAQARSLRAATTTVARKAVIADLAAKLRQRRPTLGEFSAKFVEIRSSKTFSQQKALALYILRKLHVSPVAPDFTVLTVEHLVPQGSNRPAGFEEADVAKLGNLILIPEPLNNELDSKPYSLKHPKLKEAADRGIAVDPYVLENPIWDLANINARSLALARRAYDEVWSF